MLLPFNGIYINTRYYECYGFSVFEFHELHPNEFQKVCPGIKTSISFEEFSI